MIMKDGGPAFPLDRHPYSSGMSLRDWFAGVALQGFLSNPRRLENMEQSNVPSDVGFQATIAWAYKAADAMIAERSKETA